MSHAFLFIILCVQNAIALRLLKSSSRFIPTPKATILKNLGANDINCPNCTQVKMARWNISITTYDADDTISRVLNNTGEWEGEAVQKACDQYRIHGGYGNMLDVGGNIGAFGLPLADCLRTYSKDKGVVISVEAVKHNSQKFRASIKRNTLDNVHLYEYAVGAPDANDTLVVEEIRGNHGHSNIVNRPIDNVTKTWDYEVPVTTIDSIAKTEGNAMKRIFFMKMDIEGYEPNALAGATEFMKTGPCLIFAELSNSRTKNILTTGDKKLLADASGSDAKSKTISMLHKWGYTQFIAAKGTGGAEGWFSQKEWKACMMRLQ